MTRRLRPETRKESLDRRRWSRWIWESGGILCSGKGNCEENKGYLRAPPSPHFRRTANYNPSIWDDCYIQSLPNGSMEEAEVDLWKKLKEEVRHLICKPKHVVELLELVDVLRQLGISYHFESEIKNLLCSIGNSSFGSLSNIFENNLYGNSLLFRLLREHGFEVPRQSMDALLRSFRNENGSFKDKLDNDVRGMLSLYEASFLGVKGEDEFDEAREFTTKHLVKLRESLLIPQVLIEQIDHALELPLHWRMPRLHTRWFIGAYEKQESMDQKLLVFAKLDFNLVQEIYKKELKEISRWWKNLGLVGDMFSFARDRPVENYLWSVGCSFEPHFWRCRKELPKLGCLLTTIDDIYDVYGSLEELEIFTNAVNEWKISTVQRLPECMKMALMALFSTINDIAYTFLEEKGLDILPQLKRVWGDQCKAYLVEATWYNAKYTPTLNEYMDNAWITITCHLMLTSAYCLSESLTSDAINSLEYYPDVVRYSSTIARLYDDLGTSTAELQRGDVSKSIQCHMNEMNVSELAARDHVRYLIREWWGVLNGEYNANSKYKEESFKRYVLNLPRMSQCMYQYGDGHGKPGHETRDQIISLLIDPIPL